VAYRQRLATLQFYAGDPQAAKRFNEAETRFVESPAGKQKIRAGANVRPEEEFALEAAERAGKARAKGAVAAIPDADPPKR
jgi:hypothetical protein